MFQRRRSFRKTALLVLVPLAIAAAAASALVASNTVPGTAAGVGAGSISGFTVSNVQYSLNATSPANIDAVSFTLNAAAGTVKAKLVSASSAYYSCSNTGGNDWSCATASPQATVATADNLSVLAVQ